MCGAARGTAADAQAEQMAVEVLFKAATEPHSIRAEHFGADGNLTGWTVTTHPPDWCAALAWLERRFWRWAPRRRCRSK